MATQSPITLTDLDENTQYTYIISATAVKDDVTITSKDVKVTFKTLLANARDYVYADLFAAEFKNAYRNSEDESMRRSIFVTLPWQVVYTTEGTATYSVDLSEVADIVGLVPQIWAGTMYNLTRVEGTDTWKYDLGEKEYGTKAEISHYFAYAGDQVDVRTPYTVWGQEKEAPVLGEATGLILSASKYAVKLKEPIILTAIPTDANNYYLTPTDVTYSVEGNTFELDNSVLRITGQKGVCTVTAEIDDLKAQVEINVIASSEAENLIAGTLGITDSQYVDGDLNTALRNVTDNNRESQLVWLCGEREEHYLIYDLGKDYYIEAIDLLFEGAFAKQFTITLSNQAPDELNQQITTLAAQNDVTFTPETATTQHYFVQDPTGTHRYVTLRTSEAENADWGIKVCDLKVYGSEDLPTVGVEDIAVDENASVEYYNLQGVRIDNPTNGLYIRRQGNTATKVLVR